MDRKLLLKDKINVLPRTIIYILICLFLILNTGCDSNQGTTNPPTELSCHPASYTYSTSLMVWGGSDFKTPEMINPEPTPESAFDAASQAQQHLNALLQAGINADGTLPPTNNTNRLTINLLPSQLPDLQPAGLSVQSRKVPDFYLAVGATIPKITCLSDGTIEVLSNLIPHFTENLHQHPDNFNQGGAKTGTYYAQGSQYAGAISFDVTSHTHGRVDGQYLFITPNGGPMDLKYRGKVVDFLWQFETLINDDNTPLSDGYNENDDKVAFWIKINKYLDEPFTTFSCNCINGEWAVQKSNDGIFEDENVSFHSKTRNNDGSRKPGGAYTSRAESLKKIN